MKLYNTLTRKIEKIEPFDTGVIKMYNCGPTVYWDMHVGNLRAYAEWDILHRALLYLDYRVERVMNFTDVGHMTDDDDFGRDKIEESASSEGVDPLEIANRYIRSVLKDFYRLNYLSPSGDVLNPDIELGELRKHNWLRATDYIQEMIDFVKKIEKNGYAYETKQAVYFDVSKYEDYAKLFGQDLREKQVGVRHEENVDSERKNPADFVLWMKKTGKYANHLMAWDSPWGVGFPGWHIECSAMGCEVLGEKFDIHTGGIDHIPIHHSNERAQNYGAYGHEVVKYWVHNEFIRTPKGEKLSKSKGNAVTLDDVLKKGIGPMDLRYHYISVNYRTPLKFNWKVLEESRRSRISLLNKIIDLKKKANSEGRVLDEYVKKFKEYLEDNLNISGALALTSELMKSDEKAEDIVATILDFDKVFGLRISEELKEEKIPEEVVELLNQREEARVNKKYAQSDSLRDEIAKFGFKVMDTPEGQKVERF
jgi:cysteinyl-tRNA synthetase